MTQELADALAAAAPPFDGFTLSLTKLDLESLWRAYGATARVLAGRRVYETYTDNADWHWHDGYISRGGPVTHAEWMSWLESPDTLNRAWRAEDYVHIGINPPDFSWYLRFHLWEDPAQWDDLGMDFSGSSELVEAVRGAIGEVSPGSLEVAPAVEWFEAHGSTWWLGTTWVVTESPYLEE